VADPAFPARVGDRGQRLQQAGAPAGDRQRVQVDHPVLLRGQQRLLERGGQDLGGMTVQRAQPHPLRVPVVAAAAGAAPVPEGLPGRLEARCGIAGAGMPGRVGERLHRQDPVPVDGQVVAGQPAQRPRQHRGRQVRHPARRQHAEPLAVRDVDQPGVLLVAAPADERIPCRAAQRRGAGPEHRDPAPVQLGDIAQHLPGQPVPEPVMGVQLGVEPGRFPTATGRTRTSATPRLVTREDLARTRAKRQPDTPSQASAMIT